jgi:5-formyltetrahydrofolate cyclo-ligase
LTDWRRAQRERLIAERLAMPAEAHEVASAAVCDLVFARLGLNGLGLVGGYWPIRREVDCLPLLARIVEAGGRAALGAIVAPKQPLEFRPWTPDARMETGPWDIPHPADGPVVTPTVLLVPLVGFDAAGHRLGYGGGFYDRTLAALSPRPLAIGLGFEFARLESIRPRPHDQFMDLIATEAGLFEPARGIG